MIPPLHGRIGWCCLRECFSTNPPGELAAKEWSNGQGSSEISMTKVVKIAQGIDVSLCVDLVIGPDKSLVELSIQL